MTFEKFIENAYSETMTEIFTEAKGVHVIGVIKLGLFLFDDCKEKEEKILNLVKEGAPRELRFSISDYKTSVGKVEFTVFDTITFSGSIVIYAVGDTENFEKNQVETIKNWLNEVKNRFRDRAIVLEGGIALVETTSGTSHVYKLDVLSDEWRELIIK